jgi:cytoskeletal protein CcmA (bactofilin family)
MAQPQTRTTSHGGASAEARIGTGARVRGRIHGEGDLVIEGHVEGDVALRGDLTVAEGAEVSSQSVEATSVTIAGTLEGDVQASGPVRLGSSARVRGDLRGSTVAIDEGARFSGRLECEFDLPPELAGGGAPGRLEGGSRSEARGRGAARR